MRDTDWCFVKEDANIAYDSFIEKNTGIFDTYFPFNIIKGKELTKNYKALDLSGIIKTIQPEEKVVQTITEPSLRWYGRLNTYKICKNKLTRLLRITKKQYHEALLVKNKSDIKATWKILNCAIHHTKCKPIKTSLIQEHSVTTTEEIASRFCHCFANVGPNLASKIISLF